MLNVIFLKCPHVRFNPRKGQRYTLLLDGGRAGAVVHWASDHWVASSNPLRGKFRH